MPRAYRRNKLAFITAGLRLKGQFDLFAFTKYKETKESALHFFLFFVTSRERLFSLKIL